MVLTGSLWSVKNLQEIPSDPELEFTLRFCYSSKNMSLTEYGSLKEGQSDTVTRFSLVKTLQCLM